jgi:hypothetical protein
LRLARRWYSALWWAAFQPEKLLVGGDQTWLVLAVSITDIHWRTFAGKSAMEPHQGLYPICSSKMISYVISWYIMLVYHISFIPVLDLSAWLFDVVCMSMIGITRSTMRSQSMPLDQELLELARSRGVWVSDASGIFNNGQLMEPTWTNHNYPPGTFAIRKLGFRSQRCQPLLVYAVVDASLPWGAAPQILNGKQMHALFSFKPVVFSYEPGFIWICFYNLWLHYDFYMISLWFLYDFYMISIWFLYDFYVVFPGVGPDFGESRSMCAAALKRAMVLGCRCGRQITDGSQRDGVTPGPYRLWALIIHW